MTTEMLAVQDPVRRRLAALGLDSPESLIAAAAAAGPELEAFLGVRVDELIASLPQAAALPHAAVEMIDSATYTLGVALELIELPETAFAIPFVDEPAITTCANHVAQMPPIRHQLQRGTCVAHAALAAYEHYLNISGAGRDLSEQFLYWNCKRSDGIPNSPGTWLGVAMPLLHRDGCCEEATWPYVGTDISGNEGQGPPPPGAQLAALPFRPRTIHPAQQLGHVVGHQLASRRRLRNHSLCLHCALRSRGVCCELEAPVVRQGVVIACAATISARQDRASRDQYGCRAPIAD
jgi:hypothetical protein